MNLKGFQALKSTASLLNQQLICLCFTLGSVLSKKPMNIVFKSWFLLWNRVDVEVNGSFYEWLPTSQLEDINLHLKAFELTFSNFKSRNTFPIPELPAKLHNKFETETFNHNGTTNMERTGSYCLDKLNPKSRQPFWLRGPKDAIMKCQQGYYEKTEI